ncbi:MAG: PrsW family glutamic-type intramembrane protease [Patescibacteria group bacterium]
MTPTTLGYVFIGGLLPSFIWLYFLLKEDATHPEPKRLIAFAFIAGMIAVPLVIPFEIYVREHLTGGVNFLIGWAVIEEAFKYFIAALLVLWWRAVDEAPDYVIYMITVALGFAAAENMLFIGDPLFKGEFLSGLFTNNIRFLGSTLLHVTASAIIGFALAFSYHGSPRERIGAAALGLILAVVLHTAFNLFIMGQGNSPTLAAFFLVWSAAVMFFAAFEVLKYVQARASSNSTPRS